VGHEYTDQSECADVAKKKAATEQYPPRPIKIERIGGSGASSAQTELNAFSIAEVKCQAATLVGIFSASPGKICL